MWLAFKQTLVDGKPKFFGADGMTSSPGISFRPMPPIDGDYKDFDVLKFDPSDPDDVKRKVSSIDELLNSE